MNRYLLEIIVFIAGAVVMVLEIVGSRIVAPFVGTSLFVWTSLIGVILASLSAGYWWGGRIADRNPTLGTFSLILFTAGIATGLITFVHRTLLGLTVIITNDIRLSAIIGATLLFALPSILLGMVSPYATRLKLQTIQTSGTTVGTLYAISTIGSIVGTFAAGFFLIPAFGSVTILYALAAILLLTSLLAHVPTLTKTKGAACLIIILVAGFHSVNRAEAARSGSLDLDTHYNRVRIFNDTDRTTGKPIKRMAHDIQSSSAMFLDSDELVFQYTKYYRLAKHFVPEVNHALMIGGAAYSYPKDFLAKFPNATLDVVEIDPKLTELARQHFRLPKNPRLTSYHEDGRTFLNRTTNQYDVIFGDAFSTLYSIPFQLTTREAVQRMYDTLSPDGVAIVNVISSIEGDKGKFLRAEYATFQSLFPHVSMFPVTAMNAHEIQNIMLVAFKSPTIPSFESNDPELASYLGRRWTAEIPRDLPILKDSHAPVEYYTTPLLSY